MGHGLAGKRLEARREVDLYAGACWARCPHCRTRFVLSEFTIKPINSGIRIDCPECSWDMPIVLNALQS